MVPRDHMVVSDTHTHTHTQHNNRWLHCYIQCWATLIDTGHKQRHTEWTAHCLGLSIAAILTKLKRKIADGLRACFYKNRFVVLESVVLQQAEQLVHQVMLETHAADVLVLQHEHDLSVFGHRLSTPTCNSQCVGQSRQSFRSMRAQEAWM
jgi:hypothetical protein